jgi:S1-C subfamily serine protease
MSRSLSHGRLLLLIILLFISTSCSLLQSSNDMSANENVVTNTEVVDTKSLEDVYPSIVMIESLDEEGVVRGQGSGTIIDSKGFILTAYHVVGDNNWGKLDNPDGVVKISLTRDATSNPEFQYYAQVVADNPGADLAILRVILLKSGEVPVSCLNLPTIEIGADDVQPGQPIRAVGYPGIGGDSITVTSGTVSGFGEYDSTESGAKAYPEIKIDAQLGGGVSGGALINEKHELIGVPFSGIEDGATDLGYARPISLATQMIEDALLNPIPGCNGGKAAKLSRDPSTYASGYVAGFVVDVSTDTVIEGATVYVFPGEVDVFNLTEDEFRNPLMKVSTDEEGYYEAPFTLNDYTSLVSIIVAKDGERLYSKNKVYLAQYLNEEDSFHYFPINEK